jgi:opine dehydrogenase
VDTDPDVLSSIRGRGGIELVSDRGRKLLPIPQVGSDLHEAVSESQAIAISTTAIDYIPLIRALAPYLRDDHLVFTMGAYYASLLIRQELMRSGSPARPTIAELLVTPYESRLLGPAQAGLRGQAKAVPVGVLPANTLADAILALRPVFPMLIEGRNVLEVCLNNPNGVAHVPVALLNLGRFESQSDVSRTFMYREWSSPGIERICQMMDQERVSVMQAYGLRPLLHKEYRRVVYGDEPFTAMPLEGPVPASSRSVPPRFLDEDVPFGLCPISTFGRVAGVPTPTTDLVIDLAGAATGRDYRAAAPSVDDLGLRDLSPEEIVRILEEQSA